MEQFSVLGNGSLLCQGTGVYTCRTSAALEPTPLLEVSDTYTFFFTNESPGDFVNFYFTGGGGWNDDDPLWSHLEQGGTITIRFKDANDNVIPEVGNITFINAAELEASGSSQTIVQRLDIIFQHFGLKLPASHVPHTSYISDWNHLYSNTEELKAALIVLTNKIEVILEL